MATRWIPTAQLADMVGPAPLRRPIHTSLAGRLRLLVTDGRLVEGVRLPSERELAARLGISRSTVAAAYAALREAGCLESRPGSGNFIRISPADLASRHFPGTVREAEGAITMTFSAAAGSPGLVEAYAQAVAALPQLLSGHGYFPDGLPALRERLAERYTARGLPTEPAQMIITSGALAAINLVAHTVLEPGDRVLVESPSYPNALESFRRHSARLVPAPMTGTGWDLAGISSALRQSAPRMAYLIPDFHNPTGALLGAADRRQLGSALRRERCIPLVDETLVEVSLDGQEMPPPFAVGSPDTITIGSASKAFWGGLRIGWIRAPRSLVRPLVESRASVDLGAAPVEQLVLAELLDRAELILDEQRARLREQRDELMVLLGRELPDWRVQPAAGGQTVWVELPEPLGSQLVAAAAAEGLIITPGHRFFVAGGGERHLRLPFTAPIPMLTEAVTRLSRAWARIDAGSAGAGDVDPYDLIA